MLILFFVHYFYSQWCWKWNFYPVQFDVFMTVLIKTKTDVFAWITKKTTDESDMLCNS